MPRTRPVLTSCLAFPLVLLTLAGCTSSFTPPALPTTKPTYSVTGDGILRVGTLFDSSHALAEAQVAGVELAVRDINDAGGVLRAPVEVRHRNSGPPSGSRADASLAELTDAATDVIIGPASASLAERLAPAVAAAGVPLISPSADQVALAGLDDGGFVARTIPSYASQGTAFAKALRAVPVTSVAVLATDDSGGVAVAETIAAALDGSGTAILASAVVGEPGAIAAVTDGDPDAVVVVTDAASTDENAAIISELLAAGVQPDRLWLGSDTVVSYSSALPPGSIEGAHGLLPGAVPSKEFRARLRLADPYLSSYRFAAEAYDATVLAALAAVVADDDGGAAIARGLSGVSAGGIRCSSFGECLDVLGDGEDIDYQGISGPVDLDESGDVSGGTYSQIVFDERNRFANDRIIRLG